VVTCRAAEYEELIRGGAPTLRRAAVVEILPVAPEDVVAYLGAADWPTGVDWAPVFARLRAETDGPVAAALSTPLMVTSARLVYQRGGGDPEELLDAGRFDCAYAVEDHLTQGLVDAAYAPDPRLPEGVVERERWSAGEARRWLTFLACYLHDRRERDLAWWLLSGRLVSPWVGPVIGLGLGAVLLLLVDMWMTVTGSIAPPYRPFALVIGIGVGVVFALLNSLVWYVSEARPPGRLTWPLGGSADRLLRGFRSGAAVALLSLGPLLLGITAVRVMADPGGLATPRAVELYVETVTVSGALAVVAGLALAAHKWLDAPPSRATQVSPMNTLAQDRRSALASAGLAGLVVALTGLLGWYVGVVAGDLVLRLLTHWTGWPGRPDVSTLAEDRWRSVTGAFADWQTAVGIAVLMPGMFFALLVLTGRAWPRFVVARVYLAARGRLPWRLMTFLADARRRELLRQSGGVYQFRHIRLQESLAGEATYAEEREREAVRRAAVRRRTVLAAGVGVAVAGIAWELSSRRDGSAATLAVPGHEHVAAVAMRSGPWRQVAYQLENGFVGLWGGDGAPLVIQASGDYNEKPSLAFAGGGRFLAVGNTEFPGAELWDLSDLDAVPLRLVVPVNGTEDVDSGGAFVVSHKGLLACVAQGLTGVWTVHPTDQPARLQTVVQEAALYDVSFLRDGSLVTLDIAGQLLRYGLPHFDTPEQDLPRSALWADKEDEFRGRLCASPHDYALALFGPRGGELWRRQGTRWRSWRLGGNAGGGAFHPKKSYLAVSEKHGGDVQLWRTDDPQEPHRIGKLTGHTEPVQGLGFSADAKWLATGSSDGTVRLWDVRHLS